MASQRLRLREAYEKEEKAFASRVGFLSDGARPPFSSPPIVPLVSFPPRWYFLMGEYSQPVNRVEKKHLTIQELWPSQDPRIFVLTV